MGFLLVMLLVFLVVLALLLGLSIGLAFLLQYDHAALPGLLQWQRFEEGCYVVGMEPCTVRSGLRSEQDERGEVRWLSHNQSCEYKLRVRTH